MVSERKDVEPIIPMGMLVQKLGCRVDWNQGTLQIHHPDRGLLPVQPQEGCPQIPRALALELIDELETKALQSKPEEKKFEKEKIWMQALVEAHPVLRPRKAWWWMLDPGVISLSTDVNDEDFNGMASLLISTQGSLKGSH